MAKTGFQIYSLGCKVSQDDAAVLRRELLRRGLVASDQPDLVIINTCTVTRVAITKDRQLVARLRREFPEAFLVIMGCWPETDENVGQEISGDRVLFIGVSEVEEVIDRLAEFFPGLREPVRAKSTEKPAIGLLATTDRSRYFIKVGDGCNQFCSYCLIPYARGRLHSRPSAEVIEEIAAAVSAGYREIVLSGIHLGKYGEDKKGKEKNLVGCSKKF